MKPCFARMFRGRRLDRNPLRRRGDRAETVIVIWLFATFAVVAPFIVRAAAGWTGRSEEHARVTALATRHEVTAKTLENVPPAGAIMLTQTWVSAVWTAPDGRRRTGLIEVPASAQQGSSEQIWVTSSGDVTAPPLPAVEVAGLADRAALGAILVLICLFLTAVGAIRHAIDRKHMAAWDAEWAVTEPRWSGQR